MAIVRVLMHNRDAQERARGTQAAPLLCADSQWGLKRKHLPKAIRTNMSESSINPNLESRAQEARQLRGGERVCCGEGYLLEG